MLAASTLHAAEPVKTIPSAVNMYVPDNGIPVIDITGQDRFLTYPEHTSSLQVDTKSSGRIVTIRSTIDD